MLSVDFLGLKSPKDKTKAPVEFRYGSVTLRADNILRFRPVSKDYRLMFRNILSEPVNISIADEGEPEIIKAIDDPDKWMRNAHIAYSGYMLRATQPVETVEEAEIPVKAHTRTTKTGKIEQVRAFTRTVDSDKAAEERQVTGRQEMIEKELGPVVADVPGLTARYVHEPGYEFTVGENKYRAAAHFDPDKNEIVMFSGAFDSYDPKRIFAHEATHARFNRIIKMSEIESAEIAKLPSVEVKKIFNAAGWPTEYGKNKYKAYEWVHNNVGDNFQELMRLDGVTPYSASYWSRKALNENNSSRRAVNETLAEVAFLHRSGKKHIVDPMWNKLFDDLHTTVTSYMNRR